jgi:ferredoxin
MAGLNDSGAVQNWIMNLCNELVMRLEDELVRWPRVITLILKIGSERFTKQTAMMHRDECRSPEDLAGLVNAKLYSHDIVANRKVFFVGISLSKFENLGNTKSIGFFFEPDKTDKELLEAVDENGMNLYYKCLDCGKIMERRERLGHDGKNHIKLDFHFAKNLNFSTNSVKLDYKSSAPLKQGSSSDRKVGVEVGGGEVLQEAGVEACSVKVRQEAGPSRKPDSIKDVLEAVDDNGINLYHKCLECGEILNQRDRAEHEDYHFAFRIANQFKSSSPSAGKGLVGKKSAKLNASKKSKGNNGPSIKSFFKKL